MSKLNLSDFTDQIASSWDLLDKEELLRIVESSLVDTAISINHWPDKNCLNRPGVYCFWHVGEYLDYTVFNEMYECGKAAYSLSKSYPNLYAESESISIRIKNKNARAFYIGKRTVLLSRISQHIGVPQRSSKTYGMHLNRLKVNQRTLYDSLYVGYWQLPKEISKKLKRVENGKYIIQQLLVFIETEMRKRLKPMVGKQ